MKNIMKKEQTNVAGRVLSMDEIMNASTSKWAKLPEGIHEVTLTYFNCAKDYIISKLDLKDPIVKDNYEKGKIDLKLDTFMIVFTKDGKEFIDEIKATEDNLWKIQAASRGIQAQFDIYGGKVSETLQFIGKTVKVLSKKSENSHLFHTFDLTQANEGKDITEEMV